MAVAPNALALELVTVGPHLEGGGRAEGQHAVLLRLGVGGEHVGVLGVGVADHAVAPPDQLGDVDVGYVEHAREHPDREVGGDLGDEVELVLGEGCVKRGCGEATQEGLVAGECTRREFALHELAQCAVTFAVGLEHRLAHAQLLVVQLFKVDRAALGGERLGVAEHLDDVVVAGDRPEALVAVGLVVPVHGILIAQCVEGGPRGSGLEQVEIGQGDVVLHGHGLPPRT